MIFGFSAAQSAALVARYYELHLLALARSTAFLRHGRTYVLPEDVKDIFPDAARHRIVRTLRAQAENVDADVILDEILGAVALP